MIYRHEVRLTEGGHPNDDFVLFKHRPDNSVECLADIPATFRHWDADWENAVLLPTAGIFILYTYDFERVPTILTIWYEK